MKVGDLVLCCVAFCVLLAAGLLGYKYFVGRGPDRPDLSAFGQIERVNDAQKIAYMRTRLLFNLIVCEDPGADELRSLLDRDNSFYSAYQELIYQLAVGQRPSATVEFCKAQVPAMRATLREWRKYVDANKLPVRSFRYLINNKLAKSQLDDVLTVTRRDTFH